MLLISLGCASLITVTPDGESIIGVIMLILLILCILSAGTALFLHRKFKNDPDSIIFKSKIVSRICIGISVILTIFLLFGIVG